MLAALRGNALLRAFDADELRQLAKQLQRKGEYGVVHPDNHVNLSQSTNDVYPTAVKIAAGWAIQALVQAMEELRGAFLATAVEFPDVLKMGRTQLQDAVLLTLGQEFRAFGVTVGEDIGRLREASVLIRDIDVGPPPSGRASTPILGTRGWCAIGWRR